jgi:hypothetical protein
MEYLQIYQLVIFFFDKVVAVKNLELFKYYKKVLDQKMQLILEVKAAYFDYYQYSFTDKSFAISIDFHSFMNS